MKLKRLCLPALLLLAGAGHTNLAAVPISRMDLPWWHHRFEEKQAELRRERPELIFLGDSITQDFELHGPPAWRDFAPVWEQYFGKFHAVNLGFKGDTTASLLWRIEHGELDGIAPKVAVVLIGANNFGHVHWNAQQTLAGIDAVLATLRQRLPDTRVLLLGVLPSIRSAWVTEQTEAVNKALAARDWQGTNVTFMDLGRLFRRDGKVDPGAFLDPMLTPPDPPLHPTAQTQARMAEAMEPVIAKMMVGDRRAAR